MLAMGDIDIHSFIHLAPFCTLGSLMSQDGKFSDLSG